MYYQFFGYMNPHPVVDFNVLLFEDFRKMAKICFLDEYICDLSKWPRNY